MGCGISSDNMLLQPPNPVQMEQREMAAARGTTENGRDSVEVIYQKIDEGICGAESECPGPRLSILQSWIEHLEQVKVFKLSEINENELQLAERAERQNRRRRSSVASTSSIGGGDGARESISKSEINMILSHEKNDTMKVRQIVTKLGIVTDPAKAKQNEELLAKISKISLTYMSVDVLLTMVEHCKKRSGVLLEKYNKLKELYSDLDGILTAVTGGSYVSLAEQTLDKQLESNRSIRDKLGAVSEQWRICSTLIQASSTGAQQALNNWNLVMAMKMPSEKLNLCLDCRQTLHSSIIALVEAQNALPQVDVPSISTRQLTELQHISQYLLTDMVSEDRSKQIRVILEVYYRNTQRALDWVHTTYQSSMQKNVQDAEDNVQAVAKGLRKERLKFIGVTMGRSVTAADKML